MQQKTHTIKPLRSIALISLGLSLGFAGNAFAKIYKWKDANGKTHYTSTPPPANANAKAKEFKVQKIKKSSLTHIPADNPSSAEKSSRRQQANTNATGDESTSARSQCAKAIKKIPAMNASIQRQLDQAKAAGKVSPAEYQQAKQKIEQAKARQYTMSECLSEYKAGGTAKNQIDLTANNSVEDAVTYLMLGAAFDQAMKQVEQQQKKKK